MIDKSLKIAGLLGVSLGALGGTVQAGEVKFPADKPEVAMDVPDTWAIAMKAPDVEMRSPEKNSLLVASVLDRDRARVNAWAKHALDKMKAVGIVFDPNAKAPPPPPPAVATIGNTDAFAQKPDSFSFSGPPSLATPGTKTSNDPVDAGINSLEALTGPQPMAVTARPKFKVVLYFGTSLNGKPVDVQLAVYNLTDKRVFVVMQESAPDDERAVAIAKSVRFVK